MLTREVRHARRPPHGDGGSSAIELVLLTPVLLALVFALIQTALVWNARHTVAAAAQHGARLARAATALEAALPPAGTGSLPTDSDARIEQSTLHFLQQTGGQALQEPTVTITRDGQYVTVTVTGTSIGVLPGTTIRVSGSSRTPVEGFRP